METSREGEPGASGNARAFEFGAAHNLAFAALVRAIRGAAWAGIGLGLVNALFFFVVLLKARVMVSTFSMAVQGGVFLVVGLVLLGAARAFERITTTEGRDLNHLIQALGGLRRAFLFQAIALLAGLAVVGSVMATVVSLSLRAERAPERSAASSTAP